eukprot:gnl/Trimastix_PCT/1435.p1 GENE.gnl/Trimastix_PCT/1435~~gnl/Trimastix_PCT/1435.p1  ORF type:complete len:476 (+),score=165.36 gnl/Trimastix_PCT/1435:737-2164(+)
MIGDMDTPRKAVDHFYRFWRRFRSWREFPQDKEWCDLNEAESRDERRWMERRNARLRNKARRGEMQRIARLVDAAFASDPRLRMWRLQEEAARAQVQRDREEQERRTAREAEERKKREEEAKQRAVLEERQQRKSRKREMSKARARLRRALSDAQPFLDQADSDLICANCTRETLDALRQLVEADVAQQLEQLSISTRDRFAAEVGRIRQHAEEEEERRCKAQTEQAHAQQKTEGARSAAQDPWTLEELGLLDRAMKRYPIGTKRRWEIISNFIGTRSSAQCIAYSKSLQSTAGHISTDAALAQFRKRLAETQTASKRAETTAGPPPARVQNPEGIRVTLGAAAAKPAQPKAAAPAAKPAQTKRAPQLVYVGPAKPPQAAAATPSSAPSPTTTTTTTATSAPGASAARPAGAKAKREWSQEEQSLFEAGMKQFPAALKTRWDSIAAMIPTRTKRECIVHYKELIQLIRARQQQAT